jgi:hypothetical protein
MIRVWVEAWKKAGPELEAIRRKETQQADNRRVLAMLESGFNQALRMPPRSSSGLVEMQDWLRKLRT